MFVRKAGLVGLLCVFVSVYCLVFACLCVSEEFRVSRREVRQVEGDRWR